MRDDVIFDPPRLVRFLHEQRITRVLFTPSLLEQVLGTPGLDLETAFEHLRVVYLNGEVVTTSLAQRFTRRFAWIRLLNDYSISETHDVCTTDLATVDPTLSPRYAPLGEPMGNVRVYLLDDELRPVPQGFTGEIYVGGDSLARGYLARAELSAAQTTAQRFVPDPLRADGSLLFRTGDSGRLLANGYLEVAAPGGARSTWPTRRWTIRPPGSPNTSSPMSSRTARWRTTRWSRSCARICAGDSRPTRCPRTSCR